MQLESRSSGSPPRLSETWLRDVCLESGADDVGFVSVDRTEIADQRDKIRSVLADTQSLVAFVVRMNPDAIRAPQRSVANLEFHHTTDDTNDIARRISKRLVDHGARAVPPAAGFPMEMDRFPGDIRVLSHKPIAVAAGLGQMGIHRNVIHPRFGSFIMLGTVLTNARVGAEDQPLDFNPCLSCKLCVATCPTGAISAKGEFDFNACYTHNYREFMGGFTDWVEDIANSRDAYEYRERVADNESVSMWQSLAFGPNYKAAYCIAVCPAGDDVVGLYEQRRKDYTEEIVRPLQRKEERVYVRGGSDAEAYVQKRFPHKSPRRVGSVLRPDSARGFIDGLPLLFQRGAAKQHGVDARWHFRFFGNEDLEATVDIHDGALTVRRGLEETPDIRVDADTATWIGFLRGERSLLWALLTRRIRVRGPLRLMRLFSRCFPR